MTLLNTMLHKLMLIHYLLMPQILHYGIGHAFQDLFNILFVKFVPMSVYPGIVPAINFKQCTLATNAMY